MDIPWSEQSQGSHKAAARLKCLFTCLQLFATHDISGTTKHTHRAVFNSEAASDLLNKADR